MEATDIKGHLILVTGAASELEKKLHLHSLSVALLLRRAIRIFRRCKQLRTKSAIKIFTFLK